MREKMNRFKKYEQRAGEVHKTNQNYFITIIEYKDFKNCDVYFNHDKSIKLYNLSYDNIKSGAVANPFHKSLCGVGYIGVGKYTCAIDGDRKGVYNCWSAMIRRCYDKNIQLKHSSYIGCTVDERWHNFQVFAEWYYQNYNAEYMDKWQLDKDILSKGNRIYSPETCAFVPREINGLFVKNNKSRGKYPIGVNKRNKKYCVRVAKNEVRVYLGVFDTPEEAFLAYKPAKEEEIKRIADKWRGKISERVYKALLNYTVEITD